jgi:hypothetical protein
MRRRARAPLALGAALLGLTLGSGCSGDDAPEPGSVTEVAEIPSGPAYNSVADLATTLTDQGLPCTLQYPGLRDDLTDAELSICTVAGDQAFLRVWSDQGAFAPHLASPETRTGTVVVGANWTVSLTTATVAQQVAVALGGIVPAPARPGSTG